VVLANVGLNNQSQSNSYTYCDATWDNNPSKGAGPCEAGCLFVSGQLANDSDIVFCPSYHHSAWSTYDGRSTARASNVRNSRGDPHHENYMGINAVVRANGAPPLHLTPEDEAKIGWMNIGISYGFRPMLMLGIKKIGRATSSMSYIADLWGASGFYHIHIDQVSHTTKSGTEAKMHAWYFDGHVERRTFSRDKYFVSSSDSSLPDGFMNLNPPLTWRVLFEDGIDDNTGRPYVFP
jgi:prepilin-type processing-associated H-X9-DG protein